MLGPSQRKGLPIDAIAAVVDEVFRANFNFGDVDYYDDPDDPGAHGPQRGDLLDYAISDLVEPVNDDVLRALVDQLIEDDYYRPQDGEEPFYLEDTPYERVDAGEGGHGRAWQAFCHTRLDSALYCPKFSDQLGGSVGGIPFSDDGVVVAINFAFRHRDHPVSLPPRSCHPC